MLDELHKVAKKKWENFSVSYSHDFVYSVKTVISPAIDPFRIAAAKRREIRFHLFSPSLGASEATIFSKRGSLRSGSQNGKSFS
jgi:hypothetical protein